MQFSIYRYDPEIDKKPYMQDYTLTLEFNPRLNRELPKVAGDNDMWMFAAPRSGQPPEGIELGIRSGDSRISRRYAAVLSSI